MKKNNFQEASYFARKVIPLTLRQKLGPLVAYFFYFVTTNLTKRPFSPQVLSIEETLDLMLHDELSAIRFGDGEISLIDDTNLLFQERNIDLVKKLKIVLTSNHKNLLICVLNIWNNKIINLEKSVYWFELHHILKHSHTWKKLLSKNQLYGDAFITRPYITIQDKTRSEAIFAKLKSIWKDKNVVLIEGEKSRNGVGNDLFDNVKSLQRILCPAENAYSKFDTILRSAFMVDKKTLILVSLGPTAKPIAYELFLAGYRVIDIGHIDMEYEMFLKQAKNFVEVKYKYFNEINARNPDNCTDEEYLKEIIAVIT